MKIIYLDSCIIIYFVEKHPIYWSKIETLLLSHAGSSIFCFSPLVCLESLVIPLRNKDAKLQRLFELFFDSQTQLEMPAKVFAEAARLRADFTSLKTPDALHLATAKYHGCDEFWTNDNRLDKIAPAFVKNIL